MPRDLEGPARSKRRERTAPSRQSEARRPDARDIDGASVWETISRTHAHRLDAEPDSRGAVYDSDMESHRDFPTRSADRRTSARKDVRHFDGGEDIRRVLDERPAPERHRTEPQKAHAAQRPADHRRADDIRSRGTRESTGTAQPGQQRQRLNFSKEETPPAQSAVSDQAKAIRHRADKAEAKLERAREHLPKSHRIGVEKTFDEQKKKTRRRLVFEEEVKSKRAHLKGSPVTRPVKAGANAVILQAHRKIHEVEGENVGVEAGHKGELMAEGGLRILSRRHKTAPYRKVSKLERKAARMNAKAAYQQALSENPQLKKSLLSRAAQKRKIKRQYAKAANEARKAAKRAKKAGSAVTRATGAIGGFIKRHPVACMIVLLAALLIVLVVTVVSSLTSIAADGAGAVMATSYLAEDGDIDNAELTYTEWETDLLIEVNSAEQRYPGYDEYRYSVDDVGHGPHELMAYLTAAYNDFSLAAIQGELRNIFDAQYQLAYTEEVEIRTRTVTRTDPATGEVYEEEEEYEWRVLNVTLTARSFTDVIVPLLDADQAQRYNLLTRIKGNRQYSDSPFDFNWLPYVSDGYGWRIHSITGNKDNHRGVDIAVAAGTDILAGHDGVVTFAGNNGDYGLVVFLQGEDGVETRYAHCSQLLVTQGQSVEKGAVIAKVGSTGASTGPHLHFEVLKDGQYLNPLYFAITNDDGSSYIPPGSPGGVEIPAYPGAPMGNGRYAALMEEAQKHLGKPYVFGAKGPDSFDCSGFVCWSLSKSGVYQIATNAQGLYNACTPVSRANAQPGDLIFFTGTYNAGRPVTHVGIYIGNGQMIHAGKPVQYASIDTRYWTEHFYSFGRLPAN